MPTDEERLLIRLEVTQRRFEKQLAQANRSVDRRARAMERRFAQMNKRIDRSLQGVVGVLTAGVSLRGAQRLVDASTRIENALKVAGLSGAELTAVYDRLFASAQKNVAPLEALVELYSRAALVQNELGVSTEELLGFTDRVAVAMRVSGKSAQESSGALLQLSQALGSGVVRAEEFNSILEGALPIAQAAAAGLEEAGGSVAKLRQLVVDGEVSSQAFFRAFEAGAVILEQKVAGAELTVSQSFIRLQNVLIDVAGQFDETAGVSKSAARVIGRLADVVETLGDQLETTGNSSFGAFTSGISESLGWLDELEDQLGFVESRLVAIQAFAGVFGKVMSGAPLGEGAAARGNRIPGTFSAPNPVRFGGTLPPPTGGEAPPARVSLADYPVTGGDGKRSGRRGNPFQREVEQIRERTAAIAAETAAMMALNPLIDDYGITLARAAAEQELLAAAQRAGLEVTPELRQQIAELADAYARTDAAANRLAEQQYELRRSMEDLRDTGRYILKGFISDLASGRSGAEALAGALQKVGDKLLDIALNDLFSGSRNSGGGFGGLLGGLFNRAPSDPWAGLRFPGNANGTNNWRGGPTWVGERGPELVNLPRGAQVVPNHRLPAASGGPQITYAPVYHFSGTSSELEEFRRAAAADRQEFDGRVVRAVTNARARRML